MGARMILPRANYNHFPIELDFLDSFGEYIHSKRLVVNSRFHNSGMFRKKFKSFREYWASLGAMEKFHLLYLQFQRRIIGCRLFVDGVVSWWSYAAAVQAVIYWLLSTYTIVYHTRNGHFARCLPWLRAFGVSVSVISADVSATIPFFIPSNDQSFFGYIAALGENRFVFKRMHRLSFEYIFSDRPNRTLDRICSRNMGRVWKLFIGVIAIIIVSSCFYFDSVNNKIQLFFSNVLNVICILHKKLMFDSGISGNSSH